MSVTHSSNILHDFLCWLCLSSPTLLFIIIFTFSLRNFPPHTHFPPFFFFKLPLSTDNNTLIFGIAQKLSVSSFSNSINMGWHLEKEKEKKKKEERGKKKEERRKRKEEVIEKKLQNILDSFFFFFFFWSWS